MPLRETGRFAGSETGAPFEVCRSSRDAGREDGMEFFGASAFASNFGATSKCLISRLLKWICLSFLREQPGRR